MKISWNWLQQYVNLDGLTPREVADRMTLASLEEDGIVDHAERFNGIVLGQVVDVQPHENADKLKVVTVNDGSDLLQIVCGGSNVELGMVASAQATKEISTYAGGTAQKGEPLYAVLAPIGATVGDFTIKKAELRGVESHGMLCGPDELGEPAKGKKEIWLLSASELSKTEPGTPFAEAIGRTDVMIDFDVLANRADCMGHKGVAREIAAVFERQLQEDWPVEFATSRKDLNVTPNDEYSLDVTIDEGLSDRYTAAVITGVDTRPSPQWLQQALASVGQKSINALVDVTNYLSLDLAQPFHAFDYHALKGASMHVREAIADEEVTALDDSTYKMPKGAIVIADDEDAMDIAGIMGGKRTSVHSETSAIVLQAAHFDARTVRQTSRAVGLRTDAVGRYEKGVDAHKLDEALEKAVAILASIFPELKLERIIDRTSKELTLVDPIMLTWARMRSYLGTDVPQETVQTILTRLECEILKQDDQSLHIQPPTWRADLRIEEDLIEEVVRVYGYDKLPSVPMMDASFPPKRSTSIDARRTIKRALVGFGFQECVNYAFVGPQLLEKVGIANESHVNVVNPLDERQSMMRTELLSGLLSNAAENLKHADAFKLFEVGRVYFPTESDDADERWSIAGLVALPSKEVSTEELYQCTQAAATHLLDTFHVEYTKERLEPQGAGCAYWTPYHPGRSVKFVAGTSNVPVAIVSEIHPNVLDAYGMEGISVGVFTISLKMLLENSQGTRYFTGYSTYQAVARDVSLVVDESVSVGELEDKIRTIASNHDAALLKSIEVFDVFRSIEKLGQNKKAVAFHVTFQSDERTLQDEDVNPIMSDIELL